MTKQVCPACKGRGEVRMKADLFFGVMTLGMSALMDKSQWETCKPCRGSGVL